MEKRNRRKFSAAFKAKVVLEALKERNTIESIASKYELHPNQVTTWKSEFIANAGAAFGGDSEQNQTLKDYEAKLEKLHAAIGQREIEIEFLKKKLQ